MPEMEARPPTQTRHGGAPRGERVPLDARRASLSADRRARQRDNGNSAPCGAPLAPHRGEWKRGQQNLGAKTRRGNEGGCVNEQNKRTAAALGREPPAGAPTGMEVVGPG